MSRRRRWGAWPPLAATLERASPADHARLDSAPDHVGLNFGQQLLQNRTETFAVVLDRMGRKVSDEAELDPTNGHHLTAPLRGALDSGGQHRLPEDDLRRRWRRVTGHADLLPRQDRRAEAGGRATRGPGARAGREA